MHGVLHGVLHVLYDGMHICQVCLQAEADIREADLVYRSPGNISASIGDGMNFFDAGLVSNVVPYRTIPLCACMCVHTCAVFSSRLQCPYDCGWGKR